MCGVACAADESITGRVRSTGVGAPPDGRFVYFNNLRGQGWRGIGMGGSLKSFRLSLDASLEHGCARDKEDETYADGVLASSYRFEVAKVEAWGSGGHEAQVAQEEWKEERVEARRRSVRRGIIGDDPNGDDATLGEMNQRGVVGGAGKADGWILGLLGLFGAADASRHMR